MVITPVNGRKEEKKRDPKGLGKTLWKTGVGVEEPQKSGVAKAAASYDLRKSYLPLWK